MLREKKTTIALTDYKRWVLAISFRDPFVSSAVLILLKAGGRETTHNLLFPFQWASVISGKSHAKIRDSPIDDGPCCGLTINGEDWS